MDIELDLGGKARVSESFNGILAVGESVDVILNTNPILQSGISYLCINLVPDNALGEESSIGNNRDCVNLEEIFISSTPYPNPAVSFLTLDYILPEGNDIEFEIFNVAGGRVKSEIFQSNQAGLNSFVLDISALDQGVYLIRSTYENVERVHKFVVQ